MPPRPSSVHVGALAIAVLVAGCERTAGPDERRKTGTIRFFEDPVLTRVPDTVAAGRSFSVSIRTYGGGCVRKGDTEVAQEERSATVTPFDVHSGANVCTAELKLFEHTATVTFRSPGSATVRFRGRAEPGDSVVTVSRPVVVTGGV